MEEKFYLARVPFAAITGEERRRVKYAASVYEKVKNDPSWNPRDAKPYHNSILTCIESWRSAGFNRHPVIFISTSLPTGLK